MFGTKEDSWARSLVSSGVSLPVLPGVPGDGSFGFLGYQQQGTHLDSEDPSSSVGGSWIWGSPPHGRWVAIRVPTLLLALPLPCFLTGEPGLSLGLLQLPGSWQAGLSPSRPFCVEPSSGRALLPSSTYSWSPGRSRPQARGPSSTITVKGFRLPADSLPLSSVYRPASPQPPNTRLRAHMIHPAWLALHRERKTSSGVNWTEHSRKFSFHKSFPNI